MIRTMSLTIAVCLILASASSSAAQKPFKNKSAVAAKKSYEEAIAKAKKEYAAKLALAIKDAGGAGDVEEATRLASEKKRVDGTDPLSAFRRQLIGTKWRISNDPKQWDRFDNNNAGTTNRGTRFMWFAVRKGTVVFQRLANTNVYVWHFDDKLRTVSLVGFKKSGTDFQGRRVR